MIYGIIRTESPYILNQGHEEILDIATVCGQAFGHEVIGGFYLTPISFIRESRTQSSQKLEYLCRLL